MSRLGQCLSRGVSALNNALGNLKLTWNGGTYACIPHQSDTDRQLEAGGLAPSADISFVLDKSKFPTLPQARQFVTYAGKTYQISNVSSSPDESHITLDCVDKDRGA